MGVFWDAKWKYVLRLGMCGNEGPDQPAHSRSLIRAFTVRKQNHWILKTVLMESKCPDETAHAQNDVNAHILRMFECSFPLDAAHIYIYVMLNHAKAK